MAIILHSKLATIIYSYIIVYIAGNKGNFTK